MIQAVLLDAFGTLLTFEPPVPRLRRELNERCGVDVAEPVAERALGSAFDHYRERHHAHGDDAGLAALHRRCVELMRSELGAYGTDVTTAALTEALAAAMRFHAYPDAAPALRALRAKGLRLVVASNWDTTLPQQLRATGLAGLLDGVVTSAELGVRKPATAIFHHALRLAGDIRPSEALHVGDELDADIRGARASGVQAVLVSRSGATPPAGIPAITSLEELPALV